MRYPPEWSTPWEWSTTWEWSTPWEWGTAPGMGYPQNGVPPDLRWGTPPQNVNRWKPVKTVLSRQTMNAGGNYSLAQEYCCVNILVTPSSKGWGRYYFDRCMSRGGVPWSLVPGPFPWPFWEATQTQVLSLVSGPKSFLGRGYPSPSWGGRLPLF